MLRVARHQLYWIDHVVVYGWKCMRRPWRPNLPLHSQCPLRRGNYRNLKLRIPVPLEKGFCLGKAMGLPTDSSLLHGAGGTQLRLLKTILFAARTVLHWNVRPEAGVRLLLAPVRALRVGNLNWQKQIGMVAREISR